MPLHILIVVVVNHIAINIKNNSNCCNNDYHLICIAQLDLTDKARLFILIINRVAILS